MPKTQTIALTLTRVNEEAELTLVDDGPPISVSLAPSASVKKITQTAFFDAKTGNLTVLNFEDANTHVPYYTYGVQGNGISLNDGFSAGDAVVIPDALGTLEGIINMNFKKIGSAETTSDMSFKNMVQNITGQDTAIPVAVSVVQQFSGMIGDTVSTGASDTGGVKATGSQNFQLLLSAGKTALSAGAVSVGSNGSIYFDDFDVGRQVWLSTNFSPNALQDRMYHTLPVNPQTILESVGVIRIIFKTTTGGVPSVSITCFDSVQNATVKAIQQNGGKKFTFQAPDDIGEVDVVLTTDNNNNLVVTPSTPTKTLLFGQMFTQNMPLSQSRNGKTFTGGSSTVLTTTQPDFSLIIPRLSIFFFIRK